MFNAAIVKTIYQLFNNINSTNVNNNQKKTTSVDNNKKKSTGVNNNKKSTNVNSKKSTNVNTKKSTGTNNKKLTESSNNEKKSKIVSNNKEKLTVSKNEKKSLGVKNCIEYLKYKKIKYKLEFKIDEYLSNRRYDFMFVYNNNKYILEFDGEQHFKETRIWHKNEKDFIEKQNIDIIKNYIALIDGYRVIRISNNNVYKIYEFLNRILNIENKILFIAFDDDEKYKHMRKKHIDKETIRKYCDNEEQIIEIGNKLKFDFIV